MLKSVLRILFNSKCEVQRQKEIGRSGGGREGERDQAENSHHAVDPEASHWSFFTLVFSVVLLEVPLLCSPSCGYPWVVTNIPITWGSMCISSYFLSHSFPQLEFLSGYINQDVLTTLQLLQAWNKCLPVANSCLLSLSQVHTVVTYLMASHFCGLDNV